MKKTEVIKEEENLGESQRLKGEEIIKERMRVLNAIERSKKMKTEKATGFNKQETANDFIRNSLTGWKNSNLK